MKYKVTTLIIFLMISAAFYSCSKPTEPEEPPLPLPPAITNISPTNGRAGTIVTITGSGFSTVIADNSVSFNGIPAIVSQASTSQLLVAVPNLAGNGAIRVTVKGIAVNGPVFTYDAWYEVSTWAGNHTIGSQNGTGTSASFGYLTGLATDSDGTLYIADVNNNMVRKITPAAVVTTLAGAGSIPAAYGAGTHFYYPKAVVSDNSGKVYVVDWGFHRIRIITTPETVSTFVGASTHGNIDGTGTGAFFDKPTGIVRDNTGNFFVVDNGNHKIRKINPAGVVTSFAGSGVPGALDDIGIAAQFFSPMGIAIDANNNLYIADMGNNKIRKITPAGIVTTLAGLGNGSGGSIDGPISVATIPFPQGLAVDAEGNVIVAAGNRIRKITQAGMVSTIAGSNTAGATDGNGSIATFNSPMGVAIDGNGVIYVADGNNYVIRKIIKR